MAETEKLRYGDLTQAAQVSYGFIRQNTDQLVKICQVILKSWWNSFKGDATVLRKTNYVRDVLHFF